MATWDLNRFVKTLAYFGTIPIVSSIDWLQHLLGSRPDPTVHFNFTNMTVILLIGANSSIGQQVMLLLQQAGYAVRTSSSGDAETIDSDVSAIVCCTDADHDQPSIDTAQVRTSQRLFDFRQPSTEIGEVWGALDDVVMGGVSQSSLTFASASALFSGVVSIDNSGGFASVRTRNFEPAIDLSDFTGIELRVKGDGARYKFMLRSETRWDGIAYCASFDTIANEWTTITIPFTDLIPVFRAKTVREAGAIDASQVRSMQLMLSKFEYDGALNPHFTPGFFQLQVESIAAYCFKTPLILVSSTGIVLPDSSPGAIALRLKEVIKEIPAYRLSANQPFYDQ
ncbi:CIA30 family protein [Microcoleus sp. FACHB-1515]|uniref:CIA30 family protein n=1 Tax=Cyanophyceae TaxID=3028117 RepID=UPI0016893832|nr:CIA30 family protein [Microcoleus sp. FACHB-1515]MBD2093003.1 CIA30 family protein [Microcoleus sp. FACHB-1515]